jgi:hypothetical protein
VALAFSKWCVLIRISTKKILNNLLDFMLGSTRIANNIEQCFTVFTLRFLFHNHFFLAKTYYGWFANSNWIFYKRKYTNFFPKKFIIKKLGNFWKFPSSVKLVFFFEFPKISEVIKTNFKEKTQSDLCPKCLFPPPPNFLNTKKLWNFWKCFIFLE